MMLDVAGMVAHSEEGTWEQAMGYGANEVYDGVVYDCLAK
jgi:hypothetical protein